MASHLAQLPTQVLANITAPLSDSKSLALLLNCGDPVLNYKLKSGGIQKLVITPFETTNSIIDLLPSLHLIQVEIKFSTPFKHAHQIIAKISPRLRELIIHYESSDLLFFTDEMETNFWRIPIVPSIYSIWNVSSSFPELQVLSITGPSTPLDELSVFQFLRGLPTTLTDLDLYFLHESKIDFWRLLPPQLTRLRTSTYALPSAASTCSNTLQSLSICRQTQYTSPTPPPSSWQSVNDCSRLVLPPHLTSLELHSQTSAADPQIRLNQPYLTSITLSGYTLRDPVGLLKMLPPSLLRLTLSYMAICISNDAWKEASSVTLPNIRYLWVQGSASYHDDKTLFSCFFLRSLPNLEKIRLHGVHNGLLSSQVGLLNPSTLRSLRCPTIYTELTEPAANGEYAFHRLTRLTKLHVDNLIETTSLAFIPPFVNKLRCTTRSNPIASINTLSRIPCSVYISSSVAVTLSEEELYRYFFAPWWLTMDARDAIRRREEGNAPPEEEMMMMSLSLGRQFGIRPYQLEGQSRLFLGPMKDYKNCVHIKISGELPRLPSTLTSLDLMDSAITGFALDSQGLFCLSQLPLLADLMISGKLFAQIPFEKLTSLRTLTINCLSTSDKWSSCPPNLTSFISYSDADFTHSRFPLPISLTSIVVGGTFSNFQMISHLPDLQVFDVNQIRDIYTDGWFKLIPTSIRRMRISIQYLVEEVLDWFAANLSHLEVLMIPDSKASVSFLSRFYDVMPSHVKFEGDPILLIDFPSLLAERAGYSDRSILLPNDPTMNQWVHKSMKLAFPGFHYELGTDPHFSLNEWTWSFLATFLSPDVSKLSLQASIIPENFDIYLPKNLTSLELDCHLPEATYLSCAACLPRGLTTLIMPTAKCDTDAINGLPPNLTILSVNISSLPSRPLWPSKLTHLHAKFDLLNSGTLSALPPNLVLLDIEQSALNADHFEALPTGLKFLKVRIDTVDASTFEFFNARGIKWLQDCSSMEPFFSPAEIGSALDALVVST